MKKKKLIIGLSLAFAAIATSATVIACTSPSTTDADNLGKFEKALKDLKDLKFVSAKTKAEFEKAVPTGAQSDTKAFKTKFLGSLDNTSKVAVNKV